MFGGFTCMNTADAVDKDKIIAELRKENTDLREQLSQQEFWFGTAASQKYAKEIISKNKELEAEALHLRNEAASLTEKLSQHQSVRNSSKERILMQQKINSLQAEVNKLTAQLNGKMSLSAEDKKLLEWGKAMKRNQSGRHESKRIDNEFIKAKCLSGLSRYAIQKELEENGVKCTLKTVIERIDKMKERGELPNDA